MDVHLDASSAGYSGRLEIIEGPTGRRRRSDEDKARIVAESLLPGARVAELARRYGVTRWQVYDWRRRVRDGRLSLPENLVPAPAFAALLIDEQEVRPRHRWIEIVLGDIVIRAERDTDEGHLSRVIRAVRAAT